MKLLKLVPDDTNIKFLRWRVPFYIVSVMLMILSWVAVFTMGLNYGVDFAGGQEVQLTFEQRDEAPIPQLRELVGGLGYGEPVVQEFGQPNQVSIRVPLPEGTEDTPGAATAIGDRVIAAISAEYPGVRKDGNDTVSGKVAGEFRTAALYALLAAMAAAEVPRSRFDLIDLLRPEDSRFRGRIATYDIEAFYYLARTAMVKDERHIDRFDRAFAHSFKGLEQISAQQVLDAVDLPEDWLRKMSEKHLTEEQKAEIEAMGGFDKLMETHGDSPERERLFTELAAAAR